MGLQARLVKFWIVVVTLGRSMKDLDASPRFEICCCHPGNCGDPSRTFECNSPVLSTAACEEPKTESSGELLQWWTGGTWLATPHRVVARPTHLQDFCIPARGAQFAVLARPESSGDRLSCPCSLRKKGSVSGARNSLRTCQVFWAGESRDSSSAIDTRLGRPLRQEGKFFAIDEL